MSEASAYGAACVTSAVNLFFLQFIFKGYGRALAAVTSVLLFALAILSTSSTAYAGLGFAISLIGLYLSHRGVSRGLIQDFNLPRIAVAFMCTVLLIIAVASVDPSMADYTYAMLDATLFDKTTSSSYLERMQ